MRVETRTVCIGERMGDIDWSYDFRKHFDCYCTTDEQRDKRCEEAKAMLRELEEAHREGRAFQATTYGGWPRCGWGPVTDVGMYDGWPYWKPVPSVRIGSEWTCFSSITSYESVTPNDTGNGPRQAQLAEGPR